MEKLLAWYRDHVERTEGPPITASDALLVRALPAERRLSAAAALLVRSEQHLDRVVDWLLFPLCGVSLRGFTQKERKRHRAELEQRQLDAEGSESL